MKPIEQMEEKIKLFESGKEKTIGIEILSIIKNAMVLHEQEINKLKLIINSNNIKINP